MMRGANTVIRLMARRRTCPPCRARRRMLLEDLGESRGVDAGERNIGADPGDDQGARVNRFAS